MSTHTNKKYADQLERVRRRFNDARENQRGYLPRFENARRIYYGESTKTPMRDKHGGILLDKRDWRSQLRVKYAFQQVETLLPRLVRHDPAFDYIPHRSEFEPNVASIEKVVNYMLHRDRFQEKQVRLLKNAIVYGWQPMKVGWAFEKDKIKVPRQANTMQRVAEKLSGKAVAEFELQDRVLRDDATLTPLRIEDVLYDPAASWDLDDSRWIFHVSWVTKEELLAKEKAGVYSCINDLDSPANAEDEKWWGGATEEERKARKEGRYQLVEMWDKIEKRLVAVVDMRVVVRDEEWPYYHGQYPIIALQTQVDLDSIIGIAETYALEDLQHESWTLDNALMDSIKIKINPPVAIRAGVRKQSQIQFRPGARWTDLDNPETDVVVRDVGGVELQAAFNIRSDLERQLERVTGLTAALSGSDSGGGSSGDTATQFAISNREANARVGLKAMHVDAAFARVAEQFLGLAQQFIKDDKEIRIGGGAWDKVRPGDIAGQYDVRAKNSDDQTNQELARQQRLEYLNTMGPFNGAPMFDGTVFTIRQAIEETNKQYPGIDSSKCFVQQQPPPMPPGMMPPDAGMVPPPMPPAEAPPVDPQVMVEGSDGSVEGGPLAA